MNSIRSVTVVSVFERCSSHSNVLPCIHMQIYIRWTSLRNYSNRNHSLLDVTAQIRLLTHEFSFVVFFRNIMLVYHSRHTDSSLYSTLSLYSLWQVCSLVSLINHCYTYSVCVTAYIHWTCSVYTVTISYVLVVVNVRAVSRGCMCFYGGLLRYEP